MSSLTETNPQHHTTKHSCPSIHLPIHSSPSFPSLPRLSPSRAHDVELYIPIRVISITPYQSNPRNLSTHLPFSHTHTLYQPLLEVPLGSNPPLSVGPLPDLALPPPRPSSKLRRSRSPLRSDMAKTRGSSSAPSSPAPAPAPRSKLPAAYLAPEKLPLDDWGGVGRLPRDVVVDG